MKFANSEMLQKYLDLKMKAMQRKRDERIGPGERTVHSIHRGIAKRSAQWRQRYGTDNPRELPNGRKFG